MPGQGSVADCLLAAAACVHAPRRGLFVCAGGLDGTQFARLKLALALEARPGILFRALVEDWDLARINRELY